MTVHAAWHLCQYRCQFWGALFQKCLFGALTECYVVTRKVHNGFPVVVSVSPFAFFTDSIS